MASSPLTTVISQADTPPSPVHFDFFLLCLQRDEIPGTLWLLMYPPPRAWGDRPFPPFAVSAVAHETFSKHTY